MTNRTKHRKGTKAKARMLNPPPVPTVSPRLLLAEDDPHIRRILERLLGRHYRVTAVSNGNDALRELLQAPFDVALLDVHMPGIDGTEVVKVYRAKANNNANPIPMLALTADSSTETQQHCKAVGFDMCLTKPIRLPALLTALQERLNINITG